MRKPVWMFCIAVSAAAAIQTGYGQEAGNVFERLPAELLDIMPPTARVTGMPGEMRIIDRSCRSSPPSEIRRRIVDASVQEWAFFGFKTEDLTATTREELEPRDSRGRRRYFRPSPEEAIRVATSIAGYWAAAPNSGWILERQNQNWELRGEGARWRDFWSAAFISWVMCESGIGDSDRFARAVAHHTYIDQAIEARDGNAPTAAFTAYEPGEEEVLPGDLLCRGSRPEYRGLDERREHMGQGARTHCDIVVSVEEDAGIFRVIGGNVRASVRMKLLPAARGSGHFEPLPYAGREIFAHLKLDAPVIEGNAFLTSPTMQAVESVDQLTLAGGED